MKFYLKLVLLALAISASQVNAEPLQLTYGVNEVDINADGTADLIIRSRWENMNAHSFDRYLIMVQLEDEHLPERFYEVPLGDSSHYEFTNDEGADCHSTAYKFSLNKGRVLEVVRYSRVIGGSMVEPQPVTVTHYTLAYGPNENGGEFYSGTPLYYLKQVKQYETKKLYCDVRDLLDG